jgi:UDP-glucuronate decarboxylase
MLTMGNHSRVLVTGGAGFLGRHLISRLLREGSEVICLDDFHSSSREELTELSLHSGFSLLEQHVAQPIRLEGGLDRIYNLACPASPVHYQADPVDTIQTCVLGAMRVLDLAQEKGARVLQASTSEIYGEPQVHPQIETYWGNVNPVGPRACYDEGKRCAEVLCTEYARQTGITVKIARIFNTYGPGMAPDDGRVVSNFLMQALAGEPLTVYGDGMQTRSFCYVSDLIEGMVRLMESGPEISAPVNLGNPEELSMLMLARLVGEVTGREVSIVHKERPADDPTHRRPDIERARRLLGWRPTVRPREGLRRTAAYFEHWLARASERAEADAASAALTVIQELNSRQHCR